MESTALEFEVLRRRVERLERQNRWMKQAGYGVLLLFASVLVIGQARPSQTVSAEKFVLRDSGGRQRAELSMYGDGPALALYSVSGETLGLFRADQTGGSLSLLDVVGKPRLSLLLSDGEPHVWLFGADSGLAEFAIETGVLRLRLTDKQEKADAILSVTSEGPSLLLEDPNGFKASMGIIGLATASTGKSSKTSAASLVLFGKDGKVLWSAP